MHRGILDEMIGGRGLVCDREPFIMPPSRTTPLLGATLTFFAAAFISCPTGDPLTMLTYGAMGWWLSFGLLWFLLRKTRLRNAARWPRLVSVVVCCALVVFGLPVIILGLR